MGLAEYISNLRCLCGLFKTSGAHTEADRSYSVKSQQLKLDKLPELRLSRPFESGVCADRARAGMAQPGLKACAGQTPCKLPCGDAVEPGRRFCLKCSRKKVSSPVSVLGYTVTTGVAC